jgi:ubiquinone biosynthesis protein UbiJ
MAQNIALQSLITERDRVIAERNAALSHFSEQISELETAIEQLSGKKVWEVKNDFVYGDTDPNYVKASLEEI